MAKPITYEEFGPDPDDATYELTKREHREQREWEEVRERIKRNMREQHFHVATSIRGGERTRVQMQHKHEGDDVPGHTHDDDDDYVDIEPEAPYRLPDGALETIYRVLSEAATRSEKRPWELHRWRLRLYCGHVMERTTHESNRSYGSYHSACPECGMDPVTIVAARHLGPAAEACEPKPPAPPKPVLTDKQRIALLEAEVDELREQLERAQKEG